MKKIICVLLVLVLVLSCIGISFAYNSDVVIEKKLSSKYETIIDGINFTISAYKYDESSCQEKTAFRTDKNNKEKLSLSGVNELLFELGSDEESVCALSEHFVEKLRTASEIGSRVQYSLCNEMNVINTNPVNESVCQTLTEIQPNPFENSSIRIQLFYDRESGSDTYSYSAVATWKNMPQIRQTDILGICVSDSSMIPDSIAGYYYYTQTVRNSGQVTNTTVFHNVSLFEDTSSEGYLGVCMRVPVPNDSYDGADDIDITNSGLTAYIECDMKVKYPQLVTNLSAAADYTHARFLILPNMSIALNRNHVSGLSYGGVLLSLQDMWRALVLITYYP